MKKIDRKNPLKSVQRLIAAAMAAALPAMAGAASPDFVVLDNPGDPNFNQLLGINDARIIVGYFGDGTLVANNGYLLVPQNHYSVENFTRLPAGDSASQTQAIGINNNERSPKIVGFYTDTNTGVTHGFLDANGLQMAVDDPQGSAPQVAAPVQNLLGVNDRDEAAGFWVDNNGNEHGFVYEEGRFHAFDAPGSSQVPEFGVQGTLINGINDFGDIVGFFSDGVSKVKSFVRYANE